MPTENILSLPNSFLIFGCSEKENVVERYIGFNVSKETLDQYLKKRMKELSIPGMSIAIINDGKIAHQNAFGYADISKKNS